MRYLKRIHAGCIYSLILITATVTIPSAKAQLIVDTTFYTPPQLIQNVLIGNGVSVTNIKINCATTAMGYFDGTNSNIGLSGGVLLTTGDAVIAIGPNNDPYATSLNFNTMYMDSQLLSIEPQAFYDPCIVEFDFIPDSNHIEFRYVFGSEEYHEFVNSPFNDAFGFFLTGPGISNPNNNIALIPSTTIPIAINNVNNGNTAACRATGPCSNCQYFVDNCNGTSIQFNAFTTVLTAYANVTPLLTYHIKLAIADASDGALDSGVFLECGSFGSGGGQPQASCSGLVHVMDYEKTKEIILFPNPVTSILNINSSDNLTTYQITNLLGQTFLQSNNAGKSFIINIAALPAGSYIFKASTDKAVTHRIFTKQ